MCIRDRGYTADGQLAAETALWLFDAEKVYLKWLGDILDGQEADCLLYTSRCV